MTWHQHPFARWLIPLVVGVALGIAVDRPMPWLTWPALGVLATLLWLLHRHPGFALQRFWFGVTFSALLMVVGYERAINHHQIHWADHYARIAPDTCWLVVEVAGEARIKRSLRVVGRVKAAGPTPDRMQAVEGKLLLYLGIDTNAVPHLWWGDRLLVQGVLQPLAGPTNPAAFDFRQYMRWQNVHYRLWAAAGEWQKVSDGSGWSLRRQAMQVRAHLLARLARWFDSEEAFGVAAALILGYREALDPEVRAAYADAGAMHILAVSGLHVGLIMGLCYLLLNRIFFFRTWRGRWPRALILLSVLWGFALLTGLSPSVSRAATMFSFFILARLFAREVFVWNILAASAFILLAIDPFLLMQPGFQLSYLALAGILAFQPLLEKLWQPTHPALRHGWGLLALSIAAQAGTAPVSMYYFHQFPLLFAVSGLAAVPGAFVLLCLGLAALGCELVWPGAGWPFGKMLAWCTQGLNELMAWLQALPASTVHHIWLQPHALWLAYAALLLLAMGLHQRRFRKILLALTLLVLAAADHAAFRYRHYVSPEWVAFQVRRHTLVGVAHKGTLWLWHDGVGAAALSHATDGYRAWKGTDELVVLPLDAPPFEASWGQWTGQSWILPQGVVSAALLPEGTRPPMPWVQLVRPEQRTPMDEAVPSGSLWLLDAALHPAARHRWQQALEHARQRYHDIAQQGAWVWEPDT